MRQLVTLVGLQEEQPSMHWVQEEGRTRVKPTSHMSVSQKLAPVELQLLQLRAQAEQVPPTAM